MFTDDQIKQLQELLTPIHKELKGHSGQFVEIRKELKSHSGQFVEIRKEIKDHSNQFVDIKRELKNHGKLLRVLHKDQKATLAFLDKEDVQQKKRLDRIEEKLDLPKMSYI